MPKSAELEHASHRNRTHRPAVITLGGRARLQLADIVAVAREGVQVTLSTAAEERIRSAHDFVLRICDENRTVYGVTTGFGHLSSVKIASTHLADLQRNLIRSHASGVGEPFDIPTVRGV